MRVVIGLVAVSAACRPATPSSDDEDAARPPSLSRGPVAIDPFDPDAALGARANALFGSSCQGGPESGCHGAGAAGLTLRLGAGGDVVDVPSTERPALVRVRPFDPPDSYLYLKVVGEGGIDGGRMPLGAPDDPRVADLVLRWIEAGAPSP